MEPKTRRRCPKCGSENYTFWHRKKIETDPEKDETPAVATKCKACGHEGKVRVPE
jgi:hypothetical protein